MRYTIIMSNAGYVSLFRIRTLRMTNKIFIKNLLVQYFFLHWQQFEQNVMKYVWAVPWQKSHSILFSLILPMHTQNNVRYIALLSFLYFRILCVWTAKAAVRMWISMLAWAFSTCYMYVISILFSWASSYNQIITMCVFI